MLKYDAVMRFNRAAKQNQQSEDLNYEFPLHRWDFGLCFHHKLKAVLICDAKSERHREPVSR